MSDQQQYFPCSHSRSGRPVICGPCANDLLRQVGNGVVSLPPQQLQYLLRVWQTMVDEGNADVAALRGQHRQPQAVYGDDRSIAREVIGDMTPDDLLDSFPYETEIQIDEAPVASGAQGTQAGSARSGQQRSDMSQENMSIGSSAFVNGSSRWEVQDVPSFQRPLPVDLRQQYRAPTQQPMMNGYHPSPPSRQPLGTRQHPMTNGYHPAPNTRPTPESRSHPPAAVHPSQMNGPGQARQRPRDRDGVGATPVGYNAQYLSRQELARRQAMAEAQMDVDGEEEEDSSDEENEEE